MAESKDRRSDIGFKISIAILVGAISLIVAFFINVLIGQAISGASKADKAIERTQSLETRVQSIESGSVEYMKRIDERFQYIQVQLADLKHVKHADRVQI